jgi:glycosyltransferase involved in cell wall biosynthesis
MSHLAYVANIRLPSERADAIQVLNQGQAFLERGHRVTLFVAWRLFQSPEARKMTDLAQAYGLTRLPRIVRVPCLDLTHFQERLPQRLQLAVFYLQHLSFLLLTLVGLLLLRPQAVLSREIHLPLLGGRLLKRLGIKVVVEQHAFPASALGRKVHRLALQRADGLVVISQGLARDYEGSGLLPGSRLVVAPDAVALRFFQDLGDRGQLRARLGLPRQGPLIVYAGGLYWAWKGVGTLLRAQAEMGERAWLAVVGGSPERRTVDELVGLARRLGLKKVLFTGFVPPAQVPAYLQAADLLALPNSALAEISRRHTSPLKLFEYLASGRPVAASDLPSLMEVLDRKSVV